MNSYEIRILKSGDDAVLMNVSDEVFDESPRPEFIAEFLSDPRHHIAVALTSDLVIGMATACDYIHPDKPRTLWVNEVGVAPDHQRRGIARALVMALFSEGRKRGCREAWVATEPDNLAARSLYAGLHGRKSEAPCVFYEYNITDSDPEPTNP